MTCLEYDEHYILTFPNGYGRCVLFLPCACLHCLVITVSLTNLSPSVQVDSDCAMGGTWWGVQHLLLQVRLQC